MDTGLIIMVSGLGVPVLAIIIILLWLRKGNKNLQKYAGELGIRKDRAIPKNAEIIEANVGVQGGEIRRIVFFKLKIFDSMNPYTAEAAWFVDTFSFNQAQPAQVISVKVDADNPQIIYPDVPWAVYTEWYDKNLTVKSIEGR
jgi:hypothetical protein